MKSMRPSLAAIFFMTNFYRARGGHGPLGPTGSATETTVYSRMLQHRGQLILQQPFSKICVTCKEEPVLRLRPSTPSTEINV